MLDFCTVLFFKHIKLTHMSWHEDKDLVERNWKKRMKEIERRFGDIFQKNTWKYQTQEQERLLCNHRLSTMETTYVNDKFNKQLSKY